MKGLLDRYMIMTKPEFKLLPCVFCTIGFNCYVVGHKVVSATYKKMTGKNEEKQGEASYNNTEQINPLRNNHEI